MSQVAVQTDHENGAASNAPLLFCETSDFAHLFSGIERIAVVGIKDCEHADAYRIPAYLQAQGMQILPVNPKLERVLDAPVVARLADLDGPVDAVNLFRAAEHVPTHVEEILAMPVRPRLVWLQLGIVCSESARRLRAEGITVVQDRCIMVEHRNAVAR